MIWLGRREDLSCIFRKMIFFKDKLIVDLQGSFSFEILNRDVIAACGALASWHFT